MEALLAVLIPILLQVESSNNDYPPGSNDNGLAKGALQIHRAYWQDGTEALGVDWPYSDAHVRSKAIKVCRAYLTRYGKNYERKTGLKVNLEVLARIHNGGPNGYKKKETLKYWRKVIKTLTKGK